MPKRMLSRLMPFISVLALSMSLGCGGEDSESTCDLDASVSGAIDWRLSDDPACLTPFGSGTGTSISFMPLDGEVLAFRVEVKDIKEGQTGTFPAGVEIEARDHRRWATATTGCTVRVDSQVYKMEDQFRKQYLTSGSGECSAPAMPSSSGASGTVTVAPFSFKFLANW